MGRQLPPRSWCVATPPAPRSIPHRSLPLPPRSPASRCHGYPATTSACAATRQPRIGSDPAFLHWYRTRVAACGRRGGFRRLVPPQLDAGHGDPPRARRCTERSPGQRWWRRRNRSSWRRRTRSTSESGLISTSRQIAAMTICIWLPRVRPSRRRRRSRARAEDRVRAAVHVRAAAAGQDAAGPAQGRAAPRPGAGRLPTRSEGASAPERSTTR